MSQCPECQKDRAFGAAGQGPKEDPLTLRDWFAGRALQGLLTAADNPLHGHVDDAAAWAYRYADAMLRAKYNGGQVMEKFAKLQLLADLEKPPEQPSPEPAPEPTPEKPAQ